MTKTGTGSGERLLTVSEVADILSTTDRFPRRLIEERRIRFVRLGRHVRIPESALREFIAAGLIEPITTTTTKRKVALWVTPAGAVAGSARSANFNPGSGKPGTRGRTGSCARPTVRSRARPMQMSG
jgi:excisionase family DNA binding protein